MDYGRSIITGMISGLIVLALDKIVTNYINNPLKFDFSSWYTFLFSLIGILVIAFFIATFMSFIVFSIVYRGLKVSVKNKQQ